MEGAISSVGRAIASFHPASMPRLSRAHYQRELIAWTLLPFAIGMVEGGLGSVIVKYVFDGEASTATLNMAVAVLSAANAFANILSFIWAAASHGRHKIRAISILQVATLAFVGFIAFVPFTELGLYLFVFGVIGARLCWSGVVVLRSTVWHANYPRSVRATMAGKLATVQAIVMAGVAFAVGQAVEVDPMALRVAYPAAAVIGATGVVFYSRMRMRGHRALLRSETDGENTSGGSFNPIRWRDLLREDDRYRMYQTCMFVFGMGNLMLMAPLVIVMKDRFALDEGTAALIVSTIPLLLMPLSIPLWSRFLDRTHIVHYRAIHCWAFVCSIATVTMGALFLQVWLLFVAVLFRGIAIGGGVLGWNLGHHDFAPPDRVSQYMGVHVTLTGIRGIVGPILAVSVYQWLEWMQPDTGVYVFFLSLALSLTGALGFVWLAFHTRRENLKPA